MIASLEGREIGGQNVAHSDDHIGDFGTHGARFVIFDSRAHDVLAHAATWALTKRGVRCLHLFGENFPSRSVASVAISTVGRNEVFYSGPEGTYRVTDRDEFSYVTHRTTGPAVPKNIHPDDVNAVGKEGLAQLRGLRRTLESFPGCVAINPLTAKYRSDNRAVQLLMAQRCGFETPETLISSCRKDIQAFVASLHGDSVYGTCVPLGRKVHEGLSHFATTTGGLISLAEPPESHNISVSSGLYQSQIPKSFEARVIVMGSTCFASKLQPQELPRTTHNWMGNPEILQSERLTVPEGVERCCIAFMRELGLLFGCFDFIVTPGMEWVFLEFNEQEQWLWQELVDPTLPLLDAFTRFVVEPTPKFSYTEAVGVVRLREYLSAQWAIDYEAAGSGIS